MKMGVPKRVKKFLWRKFAPVWPRLRDFLLRTGIIWHEPGRQRFHIGWLEKGKTPDEFMFYLESLGFHDHSLAWVDDDELWGIRKEDGDFQYHIRLFKDREVRGHYEYTPEAAWYKHFWEIGMEERREEFLGMVGEWLGEKSK